MTTKRQDFVTFYSPGTFFHEATTQPIESWNVDEAVSRARRVSERYGATPFAFEFSTRERGDDDLDSKEAKRSHRYHLGGVVLTLADVRARNDPKDAILIANMESAGYAAVVQNDNSWRSVQPLHDGDVVLDFTPASPGADREVR